MKRRVHNKGSAGGHSSSSSSPPPPGELLHFSQPEAPALPLIRRNHSGDIGGSMRPRSNNHNNNNSNNYAAASSTSLATSSSAFITSSIPPSPSSPLEVTMGGVGVGGGYAPSMARRKKSRSPHPFQMSMRVGILCLLALASLLYIFSSSSTSYYHGGTTTPLTLTSSSSTSEETIRNNNRAGGAHVRKSRGTHVHTVEECNHKLEALSRMHHHGAASSSTSTEATLDNLVAQLDAMLLYLAKDGYPGRLTQVSSLGPSGMVILHRLQGLGLLSKSPKDTNKVSVITLDTLHLFPETYQFMDTVQRHFGDGGTSREGTSLLHIYQPDGYSQRSTFDATFGAHIWRTHPDRYVYWTKVEPLERALRDLHSAAYLTGRRRSQGGERAQLSFCERHNPMPPPTQGDEPSNQDANNNDVDNGIVKINPLLLWNYTQVWDYIHRYKVPYHPLHDAGYKSIGDVMTSVAVGPRDGERAGRFVGLNRTECGLHAHLAKVQKLKEAHAAAAQQGEGDNDKAPFVPPVLPCPACGPDISLEDFQRIVLDESQQHDVLLEFYSPYCGSCIAFGPHMAHMAELLQQVRDHLHVVRFDVTEQEIPQVGRQYGLVVEETPALFLVQYDAATKVRVVQYDGPHDEHTVLQWLEQETTYVNVKTLWKE